MTSRTDSAPTYPALMPHSDTDAEIEFSAIAQPVLARWKQIVGGSLVIGLVALGISFAIKPVFTATTTFLPPQQQQTSAVGALASLGSLAGLATSAAGIRSPIDQYVALLQSTTIRDRLIDQFGLMEAYGENLRTDARAALGRNVRVSAGKRDGIITVEVDDTDPKRAADIGNRHVTELQWLTAKLALTEAQQRRAFFEQQLVRVREKLNAAQQALEASGFNSNVLRAEPKAAAESYAKLRAEMTAAEVRLAALRGRFADSEPEVQLQVRTVDALRREVAGAEASSSPSSDPGYISKYREFKYQETLFELFSRQFEMARLDESREGSTVQVIDVATTPERKSRPKRAVIAIVSTVCAFVMLSLWFALRHHRATALAKAETAQSRL